MNDIATIEKNDAVAVADAPLPLKKQAKKLKIKKSALPRKAAYFILYVPDMAKAVDFYRGIGLKLGAESPEWTEFKAGGIKFALHLAGDAKAEGTCATDAKAAGACASSSFKAQKTTFTFGVKDAGKTYEAFKALGVKVLSEPFQVCEDGRCFNFEDPFGNELSIFGR